MTNFISDRQTSEDLNLMGRFKKDSIINIFDRTHTRHGRQMLENMFRNPMTDAGSINERSRMFRYYKSLHLEFPFEERQVEAVEYFLNLNNGSTSMASTMSILVYKLRQIFANDSTMRSLWSH